MLFDCLSYDLNFIHNCYTRYDLLTFICLHNNEVKEKTKETGHISKILYEIDITRIYTVTFFFYIYFIAGRVLYVEQFNYDTKYFRNVKETCKNVNVDCCCKQSSPRFNDLDIIIMLHTHYLRNIMFFQRKNVYVT